MDGAAVDAVLPRKPSGEGGRLTLRDKWLDDLDNVSEATTSSDSDVPDDEGDSAAGGCSASSGEPSVQPSEVGGSVLYSPTELHDDSGLSSAVATPRASPGTDGSSSHGGGAGGVASPGHASGASTPRLSQLTVGSGSDSNHSPSGRSGGATPPVPEPDRHDEASSDHEFDDDMMLADLEAPVRLEADVLQTPWGTLRYHLPNDELAAQCGCRGHALPGAPQCKLRKKTTAHPTAKRGPAVGQGRCVARLIAGLQAHACDRWHHIHDTPVASLAHRRRIRQWANDQPDVKSIRCTRGAATATRRAGGASGDRLMTYRRGFCQFCLNKCIYIYMQLKQCYAI
jgi:hypothetical protein